MDLCCLIINVECDWWRPQIRLLLNTDRNESIHNQILGALARMWCWFWTVWFSLILVFSLWWPLQDFEKPFAFRKFLLYSLLYDFLNRLIVLACFDMTNSSLGVGSSFSFKNVFVNVSKLFLGVLFNHGCVVLLIFTTILTHLRYVQSLIVFLSLCRFVLKLDSQVFLVKYDDSFVEVVQNLFVAFAQDFCLCVYEANFGDN